MGKIDKNELYGEFNESVRRQYRLQEMALAKQYDLPLVGGVNAPSTSTTHNHGAGLLRTAALCLALLGAGAGGAAFAALLAGRFGQAQAVPPMESQQYEVHFWADDGTQLDIKEPLSE